MALGLAVDLTDDDCDWIYSTFMHRIELLGEWLETDGPDQAGADYMREELAAAESVVKALERAGYDRAARLKQRRMEVSDG